MALEDPNKKVPEPVLEPGEVEILDDDYYPDDFYDDYDDFYIETLLQKEVLQARWPHP